MVARGDLGIEIPIARVPVLQKRLIALAGRLLTPWAPTSRSGATA